MLHHRAFSLGLSQGEELPFDTLYFAPTQLTRHVAVRARAAAQCSGHENMNVSHLISRHKPWTLARAMSSRYESMTRIELCLSEAVVANGSQLLGRSQKSVMSWR